MPRNIQSVLSNENHTLRIRQEGSLDMQSHRIEYGARSVKIVGVKLWNRLEKDLAWFSNHHWLPARYETLVFSGDHRRQITCLFR